MKNNILLIDDEVEILNTLRRQLRRKYNVLTCNDPREAIDIMNNNDIQVVLSDQRMPELSGVELFGLLKSNHPDTIRLLITGYTDLEAVIDAINTGSIYRYIQKPWNPVELELIIDEAFEKYNLMHSNRTLMQELKKHNEKLDHLVNERTKELENANEHLQELNKEKNRFLRTAAHDLRNPIGVASSLANLIAAELNTLPDNLKIKYLKIIEERCDFSLEMINNLLDISKIETGNLDAKAEPVNYAALVNKTIEFNTIFSKQKHISITADIDPTLGELLIDKQLIEQVLTNLISNAIKYSYPEGKIKISCIKSNGKVLTRVKDYGTGIKKDEQEGLFTPFYRSSTRPTAGESSTGLGLAIAKKIITVHDGTIGFESEEGKGSCFWFTLPE